MRMLMQQLSTKLFTFVFVFHLCLHFAVARDVQTLANCMNLVTREYESNCRGRFEDYFRELDADGDGQLSIHERHALYTAPIDDMILPKYFPEGSNDICTFEHFCDTLVTFHFPELAEDAGDDIRDDFCQREQLIIDETCEQDWNGMFPDRQVEPGVETDVSMTKSEFREILMTVLTEPNRAVSGEADDVDWDLNKFLDFMEPDAGTERLTLLLNLESTYELPALKVNDYTHKANDFGCVSLNQGRRELFLGLLAGLIIAVITSSVIGAAVETALTGGDVGDFATSLAVHAVTNTITAVGCVFTGGIGCAAIGAAGGIAGALTSTSLCEFRNDQNCWKVEDYIWNAAAGAIAGRAGTYMDDVIGGLNLLDDASRLVAIHGANSAIGSGAGSANAVYTWVKPAADESSDAHMDVLTKTDCNCPVPGIWNGWQEGRKIRCEVNSYDDVPVNSRSNYNRYFKFFTYTLPTSCANTVQKNRARVYLCDCPIGTGAARRGDTLYCAVENSEEVPQGYIYIFNSWDPNMPKHRYDYRLPSKCSGQAVQIYDCHIPKNWCGGDYTMQDCDGDGKLDHVCRRYWPKVGVISTSSGCEDNYPKGVCTRPGSTYVFDLVSGVHYGGVNIGGSSNCGEYSTQQEIQDACEANPLCVGYSMVSPWVSGRRKSPWCLKSTEDATATYDSKHDYYRKRSTLFTMTGDCDARANCVSSRNYPNFHGNRESCSVEMLRDASVEVGAIFNLETCCDHLMIHGDEVKSSDEVPRSLKSGVTFTWSSDRSVTRPGWQLCFAVPGPQDAYSVLVEHHCAGRSIMTWSDGSDAEYGVMTGIENCATECNLHEECFGFVYRNSDQICGFWKMKINFNPNALAGHKCYSKQTLTKPKVKYVFDLESNVHYGGSNIGPCFSYSTRQGIRDACAAHPRCVGYSMIFNGNTWLGSFSPGCLKSTEDARTSDSTHDYYRKRMIIPKAEKEVAKSAPMENNTSRSATYSVVEKKPVVLGFAIIGALALVRFSISFFTNKSEYSVVA